MISIPSLMDLLEENLAFMDSNTHLMTFRPSIGESFTYKEVSPKNTLRITSILETRKLISHGT